MCWHYLIKLSCALPCAWDVDVDPPRLVKSPWLSSMSYGVCFTSTAKTAWQIRDLETAIRYVETNQHIKEFVRATIWKRYCWDSGAILIKCFPSEQRGDRHAI